MRQSIWKNIPIHGTVQLVTLTQNENTAVTNTEHNVSETLQVNANMLWKIFWHSLELYLYSVRGDYTGEQVTELCPEQTLAAGLAWHIQSWRTCNHKIKKKKQFSTVITALQMKVCPVVSQIPLWLGPKTKTGQFAACPLQKCLYKTE